MLTFVHEKDNNSRADC